MHWLIVGERTSNKDESRNFESGLRSTAAQPPLAGRVHFLGSIADVPRLMTECVLLVHAARQEPLGRVLLEAAASGLAVVATDVGGTREIFPTALTAPSSCHPTISRPSPRQWPASSLTNRVAKLSPRRPAAAPRRHSISNWQLANW